MANLSTAPVRAITELTAVGLDGERTNLDLASYLFDISADGCGKVSLLSAPAASRIAVRFTAGLSSDWSSLPDGIRHGVIRFAAYQYRERNEGGADRSPPAAIAALWHPWRVMRFA